MKKITAIVIGCGDRGTTYCHHAYEDRRDEFELVAAIDPSDEKLRYMRENFGLKPEQCYHDMSEVLCQGKIADCVINGTMDKLHIQTAIPFLEQGYDMLLEKPICNNEEELFKIKKVADEHGCKLIICHVLRYAPIYVEIKKIIDSGKIGTIMNMETSERVGTAHASVSYCRGKWNKESCGSGMLLAKCCHDLDLACWLNNATKPKRVVSFGGRDFLTPEYAPKEAGNRCMVDCPLNDSCIYSAENFYVKHDVLPWIAYECTGKLHQELTMEEKVESLKTYNPHGICMWKTDADVVDHQSVMVQFENGSTLSHTMTQGIVRAGRNIYIQGTKGEIEGYVESSQFVVRTFDYPSMGYKTENIDVSTNGVHFGGDKVITNDFIDLLQGKEPSMSCTPIADSIYGHMCVFAAEKSRLNGGEPQELNF